MNGEVSEKNWERMSDDEKLWLIFDTMKSRDKRLSRLEAWTLIISFVVLLTCADRVAFMLNIIKAGG